MQKVYYVSGPMRGYPHFNFPAFAEATARLRAEGHIVFNPAERDIEAGFDANGLDGTVAEMAEYNFDLREALRADCEFICKQATHIFMLPGWDGPDPTGVGYPHSSTGAVAERALGLALGLVIEGAPA